MPQPTRATAARPRAAHRSASERIKEAEHVAVDLPVVGRLHLRPDRLVYYGGLAALAAFGILEWPIAVVLTVGHALTENRHSRVAQAFGEVLEESG